MASKPQQGPKGKEGFNSMARKAKVYDSTGVDPEMAETLNGEMARRTKIRNMTEPFGAVTVPSGSPSKGTTPTEVPTDKHWAEVEAQIQQKRATVRGLRRLKNTP